MLLRYCSILLSLTVATMINISMDKKQQDYNSKKRTETHKPQKSLKERCEEIGAIPLEQFEKEFWESFYEGYRKEGKKNNI